MGIKFYPDLQGLPEHLLQDFDKHFVEPVKEKLHALTGKGADETAVAAIIGLLLLDEQFYPATSGFDSALKSILIDEYLGESPSTEIQGGQPVRVRNSVIFEKIQATLDPGNEELELSFQQFAFVGRYIIGRTDEYPFGHANFRTLIAIAIKEHVSGRPTLGSLELPPLAQDETAGSDIEPDNVRAVAMVYAGYQLERMKLFYSLDRLREQWNMGLIPTGFGKAGALIDAFDREADDRFYNEAQRFMHYSRALGVAGGDVSREVQPNTDFNELMMRFVSSLSEFDRQRRIGDLFDRQQARKLSVSAERIRKAGRDLAANASLYGYGGAHFAARRINDHVDVAFKILDEPEIKQAYGVTSAYQVIERQAAMDGVSVNLVQTHTLARSGKLILDLVAKHHTVWSKVSFHPLFSDNGPVLGVQPDIPDGDRDQLLRSAEHFLAVQGVTYDELDRYAQPEESAIAPSLPSFGRGSIPGPDGERGSQRDSLLERLARGELVSPEEARSALLPAR